MEIFKISRLNIYSESQECKMWCRQIDQNFKIFLLKINTSSDQQSVSERRKVIAEHMHNNIERNESVLTEEDKALFVLDIR